MRRIPRYLMHEMECWSKREEWMKAKNRVLLDKAVTKFIRNTANCLKSSSGNYYFIPLWFKETEVDDVFELYSFDHLPDELKEAISHLRKVDAVIIPHQNEK